MKGINEAALCTKVEQEKGSILGNLYDPNQEAPPAHNSPSSKLSRTADSVHLEPITGCRLLENT